MIVELKGVEFQNKGAELMLYSILDAVSAAIDNVKFTMAPNLGNCPYEKMAQLGIYPKVWLYKYGLQWGYLANRMPRKLFRMYGMIVDAEVDAVLDASGFAYGEQWGPIPSINMAKAVKRWKRQGTKVILLPQAMGPFKSKDIRRAFETIAEYADKIYPRDQSSYDHIIELVGPSLKIRKYPDFTVLLKGEVPDYFNGTELDLAIIPNKRMIDKTSVKIRDRYVPFLVTCLRYFTDLNYKPFFLVHAGEEDRKLAEEAIKIFGDEVPIVQEDDPLKTKGIIGVCKLIVSSRYHGLINALSQGVPSIGTGWSHKYEELFDYYGRPELLLSPDEPIDKIRERLAFLHERRDHISEDLRQIAEVHKQEVRNMWDEVMSIIK